MLLDPPRRAFLVQKCEEIAWGRPKGSKNPEKAIPKSMQKNMPEKLPNIYQKPSKIMPKRIPKSQICYTFAKKAEMLQTVCFPIENVVLGIQQVKKVHQKWMQNANVLTSKKMQN